MKNFVVIKKIPIFGGIYVIEDEKTRRQEDEKTRRREDKKTRRREDEM